MSNKKKTYWRVIAAYMPCTPDNPTCLWVAYDPETKRVALCQGGQVKALSITSYASVTLFLGPHNPWVTWWHMNCHTKWIDNGQQVWYPHSE